MGGWQNVRALISFCLRGGGGGISMLFLLQGVPCFYDLVPFFPRNFGGSEEKMIAFLVVFLAKKIGSVPTTPDPNTSAKASRYKWEPYRNTNWQCIYNFLPRGGHTFVRVPR